MEEICGKVVGLDGSGGVVGWVFAVEDVVLLEVNGVYCGHRCIDTLGVKTV